MLPGLQLTKFPPNHQELRLQCDKARNSSTSAEVRIQGMQFKPKNCCHHYQRALRRVKSKIWAPRIQFLTYSQPLLTFPVCQTFLLT